MPLKRKRRRRRISSKIRQPIDRSDRFIIQKTSTYLYRHLTAFPYMELDEEFFDLLAFGMEVNLERIIHRGLEGVGESTRGLCREIAQDCIDTNSRFNDIIPCLLERGPKAFSRGLRQAIIQALKDRVDRYRYRGQSQLERNLQRIREIFRLTQAETEFCLFLYIIGVNSKLSLFFVDELNCQRLNGRKYLANALGLTKNQVGQVLTGSLKKIGFFEMDQSTLEISEEFLFLFEGAKPGNIARSYFKRVPNPTIPLDYHLTVQGEVDHVIRLLETKPETSTHILVYGPPGTGKSSFAQGIVQGLNIPAYQVVKNQDNTTSHTRGAIMACLNMTNGGDGSLIVVDEADNLLNTYSSWFFRGETQDKGWLNQLLEEPGVRMIWITNEIDLIAPSVLRRFAFSLHFKPFNKSQRVLLWENVLRRNRAKRFFTKAEIANLAGKYKVSAGVIDMAVRKAKETNPKSRCQYQGAVSLALEAHQTLVNSGQKVIQRDHIEVNYSLEGLNIDPDIDGVLVQLEAFSDRLRSPGYDRLISYNLLFHGPPGTGKSELAKYIGHRLDREIITKRASDLQSKYIGETEKNIREAFEEAQREEAVLIIDEADSFLFSRGRAERSWEITSTNEFLTQMEGYRGILICTTNRLIDLDQASIRRFQAKLELNYLTPEGNLIFYDLLLRDLVGRPMDRTNRTRLKAVTDLAPGDFKAVMDRFVLGADANQSHQTLVETLEKEAQVKRLFTGTNPIGF